MLQTEYPTTESYTVESVATGRGAYSGQQTLWYNEYDTELPRFNAATVRLMRIDAEVHAAVEFVVDAILSDGVQLVGAQFQDDSEFAESELIKDFIARCFFEAPNTPFLTTLKELARGATYQGHKVAEIVAREELFGADAGRLVLDKLKVKPTHATAFVVDQFYNVVGLISAQKGQINVSGSNFNLLENMLPTSKFFICTLEERDGDPRGVSQVRAAFNPWADKQETRKQFAIWRRKTAIRSFIGTTPENADKVELRDSLGQPVVLNGIPQTRSAISSTAATLAKMQSDTVAVFPFGTVVTALDADGTGQQFKLAYDLQNAEIRKSILLSTQATGEPDKGGLGAGGHAVHERVLGRRIASFRDLLADQIYDLARTFVVLNFGEAKAHLTPKPSLGNFDKQELKDKLASAIAGGYRFDQSQYDEMDVEFNFPRRDLVAAVPEVVDPKNPDSTKGQMK